MKKDTLHDKYEEVSACTHCGHKMNIVMSEETAMDRLDNKWNIYLHPHHPWSTISKPRKHGFTEIIKALNQWKRKRKRDSR